MPEFTNVTDLMLYLTVGQQNKAGAPVELLTMMLDSAEDFVESFTGRKFSPEPALASDGTDTRAEVTKTFKVRRDRYVRVPDLRSASSILLGGTTLIESQDYDLGDDTDDQPSTMLKLFGWTPFSPIASINSIAYTTVSITGRWGFLVVPPSVKEAVYFLAARRYRQRDAMFSDVVQTAEGGVFSYFRSLPEDLRLSLMEYKMPNVGLVTYEGASTPRVNQPFRYW